MVDPILKVIKPSILVFSILMFIYQAQIAVTKLQNPPVVDSTNVDSIEEKQLPLITICAEEQWIWDKIGEQYSTNRGFKDLLIGNLTNTNQTAWGAQLNMTFDEMIEQMQKLDQDPYKILEKTNDWRKIKYERRFYTKSGWCADIENYTLTPSHEIQLIVSVNKKSDNHEQTENFTAEVFLTDKKLRSKNTIYKQSHWGPSIIIRNYGEHSYMVKVEKLSNYNPRQPEDCKEYSDDEFDKCVDEELQKLWKPVLGCNPPWLTEEDQCTEVLNDTEIPKLANNDDVLKTLYALVEMNNLPAYEKCPKPCTISTQTLFLNKERYYFESKRPWASNLNLKFNPLIVHRTKVTFVCLSQFIYNYYLLMLNAN